MIREVYDALVAGGEAALGLQLVKGYPSWGRPNVAPPIGALELQGPLVPRISPRVGSAVARWQCGFQITIFARHEAELCTLLDGLTAWLAGLAVFTAGSKRCELVIGEGVRIPSQTGAQQEQYVFGMPITVLWPG